MAQYEVMTTIFSSTQPVSKEKIIQNIDLHQSSIRAAIRECEKHGYIVETKNGYEPASDFDKDRLESIRPRSIDELTE